MMKVPCVGCGRLFLEEDGFTRCLECRERTKVYTHQLHRRRGVRDFPRHDCHLCRKHKEHVRQLIRRWDQRQAWMVTRCKKGHRWLRRGPYEPCPTCSFKAGQAYLKQLKQMRRKTS